MKNLLPANFKLFGAIILVSSLVPAAATTVTFSLSLDTAKDPGSSYTGFHAAGAGLQTTYVIGFNIQLTSIDGNPVAIDPVAAFCAELAEPISVNTFTFDADHLFEASAGRAGEAVTASSGIPEGGIGLLRAARVRYLFDNYYHSVQLSAWTQTSTSPNLHAFQLALWELTHDTDMQLLDTSGLIHVGSQSNTLRANAVTLAESWLADVAAVGVTEDYQSINYEIWALTSASGNSANGRGYQDVLLALDKSSPTYDQIATLLPAPEPAVSLLGLFGALAVVRRRR
jgi:hypothetical protein